MNDYYKLLGVPQNASQKSILSAFRKSALENHPDRISSLPDDERHKREELMYSINEAFEILSDSQKRSEYDRVYSVWHKNKVPEGNRRSIRQEEFMTIPENDWGLLAALKTAYKSNGNGKWRVRKAESDKRAWMPEEVYQVKREGDSVTIARRIVDWRFQDSRNLDIRILKAGEPLSIEEVKANTFLGEYYLKDSFHRILSDPFCVQPYFMDYLSTLKHLAKKSSEKEGNEIRNYITNEEIRGINDLGVSHSKNTRVEGSPLFSDDENLEWVRNVPLDQFWKRMREADGLVRQVEGTPKAKEGQVKTPYSRSPGEKMG